MLAPSLSMSQTWLTNGTRFPRVSLIVCHYIELYTYMPLWLFGGLLIQDFDGILCVDVARSAPDGGSRDNISDQQH